MQNHKPYEQKWTKKILSTAEYTIGFKDRQQQHKMKKMKLGHYPNSSTNRVNNKQTKENWAEPTKKWSLEKN